ncbi:hypothetical protein Cgig2_032207 [Carnegiea gigantea]|uniref:Uncharacterized protein n=1 Tax=Carnegiea gigantea TaxID=171969 RepID=A0A9Q1K4Q1_9CARY|nr:hypothetical protein Cgig2_032207 [Carnegiea gigantea]
MAHVCTSRKQSSKATTHRSEEQEPEEIGGSGVLRSQKRNKLGRPRAVVIRPQRRTTPPLLQLGRPPSLSVVGDSDTILTVDVGKSPIRQGGVENMTVLLGALETGDERTTVWDNESERTGRDEEMNAFGGATIIGGWTSTVGESESAPVLEAGEPLVLEVWFIPITLCFNYMASEFMPAICPIIGMHCSELGGHGSMGALLVALDASGLSTTVWESESAPIGDAEEPPSMRYGSPLSDILVLQGEMDLSCLHVGGDDKMSALFDAFESGDPLLFLSETDIASGGHDKMSALLGALDSRCSPLSVTETESASVIAEGEVPLIPELQFNPFPVFFYYMMRWTSTAALGATTGPSCAHSSSEMVILIMSDMVVLIMSLHQQGDINMSALLGALETANQLSTVGRSSTTIGAGEPSIPQLWLVNILLTFPYMVTDVSSPSVEGMHTNNWF